MCRLRPSGLKWLTRCSLQPESVSSTFLSPALGGLPHHLFSELFRLLSGEHFPLKSIHISSRPEAARTWFLGQRAPSGPCGSELWAVRDTQNCVCPLQPTGMLLAGFLLRNVPLLSENLRVAPGWSSALRSMALAIILVRAGLGLDSRVGSLSAPHLASHGKWTLSHPSAGQG